MWIGQNEHKGLGVFTFSDLSLRVSSSYDPVYELFLPLLVTGRHKFNLLAVWAFNHRTKNNEFKKDAPTRAAIGYYRGFIVGDATMVAGDFNHNVIWDKPGWKGNFAHIAADLKEIGLISAYLENGNHRFGEEPDPTLIWRKNLKQVYHIDYCFVPKAWLSNVESVSVGRPEKWIKYSDHTPLVIEIAPERNCCAYGLRSIS